MPARYLAYKPIFRVDVADQEYFKIAGRVGLPEFTWEVESKFWKRYRPELKLWENESVVIAEKGLWANLGVYSRKDHSGEIAWALKYSTTTTHKYFYGLMSTSESTPATPIPKPGAGEGASTKQWFLRCTNFRLVSHIDRSMDEQGFLVIHFPWSMLAHIGSEPYDKEFLGKTKHFIKLLFCLGERNYWFVSGPVYFDKLTVYAHAIYETALKAKIGWLEFVKQRASSSNTKDRLSKRIGELQRELEGQSPEHDITVAEQSVSANQTFFPSLHPFRYYKIIRENTTNARA